MIKTGFPLPSSVVCDVMLALGRPLPNLIITFFTRVGSAVIMTFCPVSLEIRQKLIGKKRNGKQCSGRHNSGRGLLLNKFFSSEPGPASCNKVDRQGPCLQENRKEINKISCFQISLPLFIENLPTFLYFPSALKTIVLGNSMLFLFQLPNVIELRI